MSETPELKHFTLEEANALVPRLTLEFSRIARLRDEVAELVDQLGGAEVAGALHSGARRPLPEEVEAAQRLKELAADVARTLARVQELGCVVKDAELGLIDFHSEVDTKRVFLCWQFGETDIGYYHGLDEGFAARQPLVAFGERPEPANRWMN